MSYRHIYLGNGAGQPHNLSFHTACSDWTTMITLLMVQNYPHPNPTPVSSINNYFHMALWRPELWPDGGRGSGAHSITLKQYATLREWHWLQCLTSQMKLKVHYGVGFIDLKGFPCTAVLIECYDEFDTVSMRQFYCSMWTEFIG